MEKRYIAIKRKVDLAVYLSDFTETCRLYGGQQRQRKKRRFLYILLILLSCFSPDDDGKRRG